MAGIFIVILSDFRCNTFVSKICTSLWLGSFGVLKKWCAEVYIPDDIQGIAGQTINISLMLSNTLPLEITSMSLGIQFDSLILEPLV